VTIADLKPYPAMKDSGVPWLGPIPASWSVVRNGRLFVERKETGFADLPILEVSLRSGVRVRRFDGDARKQLMLDRDKYKRACAGDLAYNMMRMWQGAVGRAPVDGLVSPAYVVARPFTGVLGGYFAYLFRADAYMGEVDQYSHGIVKDRNRLYWDQFKQMPSACPPTEEQATIIRFLSHAVRQIGRYIRAKQKLIKLLEEQKQAIINRAVTRGLDPNVRLKPSGLQWLGEMPEHWTRGRLKDAASIQTGLTLGKRYTGVVTESRTYLRVANVQVGRLDLRHTKRVDVPADEAKSTTLRSGDVLMTEGGDIDKLGRGCVWRDEIPGCLHQNHIFAVRCRNGILLPEFLVGLMSSRLGRAYFQLTAKQTTNLASTNGGTLSAFPILIPSIAEQRAILDAIAEETTALNVATDRAKREIVLLREYRTRLIADVVTGRLDVREAAAALPDEADEPELLGDSSVLDAEEVADDGDSAAVQEEDEA